MNVALRSIKNKRVVLALAPKRWPNNLPPPVHVADTEAKARAVSLLRGIPMRDGEAVYPSDLTPAQARDVAKHIFPIPAAGKPAAIPDAPAAGIFSSQE